MRYNVLRNIQAAFPMRHHPVSQQAGGGFITREHSGESCHNLVA